MRGRGSHEHLATVGWSSQGSGPTLHSNHYVTMFKCTFMDLPYLAMLLENLNGLLLY